MYYSLNKEVFLVQGPVNSLIYDIPNNSLYQVDKPTHDFIIKAVSGEVVDSHDVELLQELVDSGILVVSDKAVRFQSIDEYLNSNMRKISFAWIELTNSCNLRCVHCYNEKADIRKRFMTYDDFVKAVDGLVALGISKIQLIGGEPFTMKRELLFDMMDYLSPKVDSFEIFVNGTLTTADDLDEIKRRYSNVAIATSLHSYIESEHEKVTNVKGSYAKTVALIRHAKGIGLPVRYVGTLMSNLDIGEQLDFGNPSRRDYIRMSGRANMKLYNRRLLREKAITPDYFKFDDLKDRIMYNHNESCFATHLYIGSDLNVYPCPMERRLCHGNLRDGNVGDMLKEDILNYSKANVDSCKDCEYRYICLDCRPDSLGGGINEKPWYCTYHPETASWDDFDTFADALGINE